MRLFWELVKLSFRRQFAYREANLAGLATNFFFGLLRAAVLVALYDARTEVAGISLPAAVTYTGLSQATIVFLSFFGWHHIMNSVYTGEIATDLLKPMNFFTFWMARDLGRALAQFLMRSLTLMLSYALIFDIVLPQSAGQWLALLLALVLSWLISFSWRFLINLAAFWTPDARGISRLVFGLSWFLSGFLMPLAFFPKWFVRLCYLTPFPVVINTVIEVYLGLLTGPALFQALLLQCLWVVILVVLGQFVLRAGVRRLVILGG